MEYLKECPDCGNAMKTIPAGISKKSGKKYEAFDICEKCKPRKIDKEQLLLEEIKGIKDLMNERFNGLAVYLKEQLEK